MRRPSLRKPVHLVVTYPAGGSSDLMARIMGEKLQQLWGQPVIIENRRARPAPSAWNTRRGRAADGYTFVVGNLGPVAVNPLLSKVPYNMEKDFLPVALTATGANILVVNANSPYKSLQDILAAARARPGVISFGTSGPGSMAHLGGEMIMRQAKVKMNGINYKGGGLAVNDLIAGHIDLMVADPLPVS